MTEGTFTASLKYLNQLHDAAKCVIEAMDVANPTWREDNPDDDLDIASVQLSMLVLDDLLKAKPK